MKTVIILASSRSNGDTRKIVENLISKTNWKLLDLNNYNFSYYDYEHKNRHDDFIGLLKEITNEYDTLIFATPVYWYSMSGLLKVFFDRLTDLLTIEKDLGRQLRGKNMAVLSSSNGNNLGDNFWLPFIESSNYLGMNYIADLHTYSEKDNSERLDRFINQVHTVNKIT